jgi:Putative adhesin
MLKRFALAAALSASFVLLYAHDNVREEFHQTYPLAAGGRVSLHNVNGSIHVTAWDRNEVKVDAIKRGEDQKALDEAEIVVDARADAVEIRTKYPGDCHDCHGASIDYTVTVPRGAALASINSVNGAVTIEGVSGAIKASSVNGRVEVSRAEGDVDVSTVNGRVGTTFARLSAKHISLSTVNGGISLGLPKDVSAHLKASTVHGSLSSDFDLPVRHAGWGPGSTLDTQIGSGGAEISLRTVNGGINLTRQ